MKIPGIRTSDEDKERQAEEAAAKKKVHESQYGGYRWDENKDQYWLTAREIEEYNRQNSSIADDAEFWAWFEKFRKERKIFKSWTSGARGEVKWEGGSTKKKGSYLSEWWTEGYFGGGKGYFSSSSSQAAKLAVGLAAIRTVIRVIDDSDPPMQVKWAEKGVSFTDFKNSIIQINPKPMADAKLKEGEAIDISTAFAMHEASHAQYTKPIWEQIIKPDYIRPVAISSLLANLLEDIRIEALTSEKFPGFIEYFVKGLEYLWKDTSSKPPKAYGPDLQSKINFAIAAVKWPKEAEKLWRATDGAEIDWWQDWSARYQADTSLPLRALAQEGILHLRLPTEKEEKEGKGEGEGKEKGEASKEMDKMSEDEKKVEETYGPGSKFREAIESWLKRHGFEIIEYCPHPSFEDSLDSSVSIEVERLVTEEFRKEDIPVKMPNGSTFAEVYVSKPAEDERSRAAYIGKPDPSLARLKSALVFRQELPQYANRLQREGGLDEEELWRWSAGDYRVFEEKVIAVHPKVQMSLLVDMSGSMVGPSLRNAQRLAQLFVWALRDMPNVTTKVFGHTANLTGRDCQVYRLWEPGDSMTRLGLIKTLPHMNNYDGFAIASVAKELMERGDENEQRVLIVLADGYPSGHGYGGSDAYQHVRNVDTWARKGGVEVIQIAIDEDLDPVRQSAMFKQWIPFTDTQSLPRKLEALLAKLT